MVQATRNRTGSTYSEIGGCARDSDVNDHEKRAARKFHLLIGDQMNKIRELWAH